VARWSTEEMHRGLRERWRAEHHLPADGREGAGRAGPSDSELTYGGRMMGLPCPLPTASEYELSCLPGQYRADGPTCAMREEHWRLLGPARADATARLGRARQVLAGGPAETARAQSLAARTFTGTPPSIQVITQTLDRIAPVLAVVEIVAASCEARDCQSPAVLAYVTGVGAGPVFLCPRSWIPSQHHKLGRTILHEIGHLVGIDAGRTTDEVYCADEQCGTPCSGADVVDAWAQYIHCLGRGPTVREAAAAAGSTPRGARP